MAKLNPQRLLSADKSQALLVAASKIAREQGLAVAIAVVDASGQLKAFLAMDQAPWVATELCQRKAKTALLGLESGELGQAVADQPVLMQSFGAVAGVTLLAGGVPVRVGDQVVGGLGVGGGTPEQDADIARQALVAAKLA